MKRHLLFFTLTLACAVAFAQHDAKARAALDRMAEAFRQEGAVSIRFSGSQSGVLDVKGNKFRLKSGGIETWFDGSTQWSYVEQNKEVNISSPTPEEVQGMNPYALAGMYEEGFNYEYAGTKTRNGRQGEEVVLTPETEQDVKSITLNIASDSHLQYICITLQNGEMQEFAAESYLTHRDFDDAHFRFDPSEHPDAEIIDLR